LLSLTWVAATGVAATGVAATGVAAVVDAGGTGWAPTPGDVRTPAEVRASNRSDAASHSRRSASVIDMSSS
jgi:hypothetical protein